MRSLAKNPLFVPVICLGLVLLFNCVTNLGFFEISIKRNNVGNWILAGNLISVLNNASELVILAIGMTLITSASGGQDISVGACVAIAGGVILKILASKSGVPVPVAVFFGCLVAMAFGAFNGILVSIFNIQPMVATLILFTAGRPISSWITGGLSPRITNPILDAVGNVIPGVPVPTPIFVAAFCVALAFMAIRFTNLGLYAQSVGVSDKAARLVGLNPRRVKFIQFVIMGLCVGLVAFIKVSRVGSIQYNYIAKDIEMDAILAVALGGNSLSGGKFSMTGSIIGAYTIQAITTTLLANSVPSDALPAYKAIVIIILVAIQSPAVKAFWRKRFGGPRGREAEPGQNGTLPGTVPGAGEGGA
ncbi:MAG: ABC transporter permease [Deltaproteobacteria bacterium]|jgi:simple sugar transport system permease protein|nr:ABC transporter permease [Deltaproteobacteria bacterium]